MAVLALSLTASCDQIRAFVDNPVGAYLEVSPASLTLVEGATQQLQASTISDQPIRFESSDTKVATVSEDGVITALKVGKATVTVSVEASATYAAATKQVEVEVVYPVSLDDAKKEGAVVGFAFNLNGQDLDVAFKKVGDTYVLQESQDEPSAAPRRAEAETVLSYTLDYDQTADVLTFKVIENPGDNTVLTVIFDFQQNTIQIIPGNPQTKVLNFTVRIGDVEITAQLQHVDVAPTEVSIKYPAKALVIGAEFDLAQYLVVAPADATDKSVTWKSSDEKVATVDENGKVTAMGVGFANISITANLGAAKTDYTVMVMKIPGSISYATTAVSKTTADINSTFTNALTNTGDGTVTYQSSNTSVATVNATTGEVTVKGEGSAVITATVEDTDTYQYSKKTATYTLTVGDAPVLVTSIAIMHINLNVTGSTIEVVENQEFELEAVVSPANATNQKVAWTDSSGALLGEGSKLKYTATKHGHMEIRCEATDGSGTGAFVSVMVIRGYEH